MLQDIFINQWWLLVNHFSPIFHFYTPWKRQKTKIIRRVSLLRKLLQLFFPKSCVKTKYTDENLQFFLQLVQLFFKIISFICWLLLNFTTVISKYRTRDNKSIPERWIRSGIWELYLIRGEEQWKILAQRVSQKNRKLLAWQVPEN